MYFLCPMLIWKGPRMLILHLANANAPLMRNNKLSVLLLLRRIFDLYCTSRLTPLLLYSWWDSNILTWISLALGTMLLHDKLLCPHEPLWVSSLFPTRQRISGMGNLYLWLSSWDWGEWVLAASDSSFGRFPIVRYLCKWAININLDLCIEYFFYLSSHRVDRFF